MKRINISLIEQIGTVAKGFTEKYWIEYLKRQYLVKINCELYKDQDYMEYLSSIIFKRMGIPVVNVLLSSVDNRCSCMVESYLEPRLKEVQPEKKWVHGCESDNCEKEISTALFKMKTILSSLNGITEENKRTLENEYLRMLFGDIVINNEERMLKNISIIYDESTKNYSLAPAYDHGLAFHAFSIDQNNPVNYIGNDYFKSEDILNYLLKHHKETIADLVSKLYLLNGEIKEVIEDNNVEIVPEKKEFIINHINKINKLCLQKSHTKK